MSKFKDRLSIATDEVSQVQPLYRKRSSEQSLKN